MVESNVKCYYMGKENYYHTGIFTNVSKSTLLMSIVDSVLIRRFNVATLCGPRTSLNTCEIILRSKLNVGIPDFLAAKDVLERYLDVTRDKLLLTSKRIGVSGSPKGMKATSSKTQMASSWISSSNEQKIVNTTVIDLDSIDAVTPDCQPIDIIDLDETLNEKANIRDSVENNENLSWCNKYKLCVQSGTKKSKRKHKSTENKLEKCMDILREASRQETIQRKLSEDDSVILCSDDDVMVIEDNIADVVILDCEDDRCVNLNCKQDSENAITNGKDILQHQKIKNKDKAITASKWDVDRCLWPLEKRRKKKEKKKKSKKLKKECKQIGEHPESVRANCIVKPNSIENDRNGKNKSKLNWQRPAHLDTLTESHAASQAGEQVDQNHKFTNIGSKYSSGVGSNIYNPNSSERVKSGLRPIIIDGSNVAVSHGKGDFSFRGLQICVDYFIKRGHKVIKVFVPQFRRNLAMHREPQILAYLEKNDFLILTPSRRVDGKMVVSYDDRYIVQTAAELGGVIVSTDNYRDLLSENPAWKETIEQRLLMFTWVDDILMFPQDPLGRFGPRLDEFLMFSNGKKQEETCSSN